MPTENSAVALAQDIAAADERLKSLSVLCGILSSGLDRSRRDLRQIRADAVEKLSHEESCHAAPSDISPEMLG